MVRVTFLYLRSMAHMSTYKYNTTYSHKDKKMIFFEESVLKVCSCSELGLTPELQEIKAVLFLFGLGDLWERTNPNQILWKSLDHRDLSWEQEAEGHILLLY